MKLSIKHLRISWLNLTKGLLLAIALVILTGNKFDQEWHFYQNPKAYNQKMNVISTLPDDEVDVFPEDEEDTATMDVDPAHDDKVIEKEKEDSSLGPPKEQFPPVDSTPISPSVADPPLVDNLIQKASSAMLIGFLGRHLLQER